MSENEVVEVSTIPVQRPEPALPATKPVTDVSWEPKDYIKPSLIRYPQYEYRTGTQFFLSKTEQIVVDSYTRTNNEAESVRTVNAIYAAHGSPRRFTIKAIHRWLQKPHIAKYIADQWSDKGKVNWLTEEKWLAWGIDGMMGDKPLRSTQVAIWERYGKAKGWQAPEGPSIQHNTMINFTQSGGQA